MIDTSKLYSGQLFKNYKELCMFLDEPIKTAGTKLKQLDELSKHCLFNIANNKEIYIHLVYDEPLELSHTKFILNRLERYVIEHYFMYDNEDRVFIPFDNIKRITLDIIEDLQNCLSKSYDIDMNIVTQCFNVDDNSLHKYIEKILKKLNGQCIIYWTPQNKTSTEYSIIVNTYYFQKQIIKEDILKLNLSKYKINIDEYNENVQGIYAIFNKATGKIYIGSSINIHKRIAQHIVLLSTNGHCNSELQKDYANCSTDFEFILIEEVNHIPDLPSNESSWINIFGGRFSQNVYNRSNPTKEEGVIKVRNEIYRRRTYQ
ncbi:GIY-YIG nuclease family protein [Paenibacillus sp. XY044]|uniref:GIY-YIG nuclease family protein n=1 Tax=Paenibacillus sp. XY044 TaxID=2026089 RepID=UPI000B98921A|nr:GIY-YIG nuclease family protein [Paenibacillus sp. XY044]OZB98044.1 hypothetical protein CJP46_02440 [Paenibacillus sp. XY044]